MKEEDPPVYSNVRWEENQTGFEKVCDSLNHFLITISLQEAVMSAPFLIAVDEGKIHGGKPAPHILQVPCRSLWLNGYYVSKEPTHDFFDIPNQDVLIMDGYGLWLGSLSDRVLNLLKPEVEYQPIYPWQ